MTPNAPLSEKEAAARLQHLHALERKLSETLIRMKTEHESASKDLEALKTEARKLYKTDDIGQLRALYRQTLEENTANLMQFEQGLMNIQQLVDHATQKLAALDAPQQQAVPGATQQLAPLSAPQG